MMKIMVNLGKKLKVLHIDLLYPILCAFSFYNTVYILGLVANNNYINNYTYLYVVVCKL